MYILILIMVSSGFIGGIVNYYLSDEKKFGKSIIMGIVASFFVPLFLNMISSDLVEIILKQTQDATYISKIFVFTGFCLVASIFSRTFMQNISNKLLQQLKEEQSRLREEIEPIKIRETEPTTTSTTTTPPQQPIDDVMEFVMTSLIKGKYTYRTEVGLAKELNLEKSEVSSTLNRLCQLGFVEKTLRIKSDKDKPIYWFLTQDGFDYWSENYSTET